MTGVNWDDRDEPNPGSEAAIDEGCKCPPIDNHHGRGSYKGGWIVSFDCPVHGEVDRSTDTETGGGDE